MSAREASDRPTGITAESLSRRVARGAASTLVASLVTRAIAVAQSVAVARLLDPYRLGLFAIVSYVLGLAGALGDLGIPVAVIKLTAEYRAAHPRALLALVRRLRRVLVTVSLALAVLLGVGADWLAAAYREPSLAPLFRLAAAALVLGVLGGFRGALLQGLQQIHRLATLGVLNGAAMLVLTLSLVPWLGLPGILLASIGTECLAWAWTARPLARAVQGAARESAPGASGGDYPGPLASRVFHLAAPSFLNGIVLFGAAWLVRSWLARALGYEAVGLYQVADSVSRALMLISGAIAIPLVPAVAEAHAAGPGRVASSILTVLRGTVLVTLPAAVFLAVGAGPLLALVFGDAYASAGAVTAWLALAVLVQSAANVLWSAQVGTGRIWAGFAITSAGQFVLVAGALLAAGTWGLAGVGVSALAAQALTLTLAARHVSARLAVDLAGARELLPAAVMASGLVAALHWAGAAGLGSAILAAVAVVLGEALLLRPAERRLVREMAARAGRLGARHA